MAEAREALRAKARSKPNTVHYGAETGDIKLLEHFVKEGMVMGHPESVTLQAREDVLGMMPIHIACETGHLDVVEFLIKKRVDLDAGDNFRVTAMHLAAIENHTDIVEALLHGRANVKPVDVEGDMPIHWAATKGHSDVIKLLVKKGSPIDVPNKKGWTPLHRAAYNGRREAVHTLIQLGASLITTTQDGNTPLHLACFMNQLGTIEKLCEFAAPQKVVNNRGQKPIDLCITDGAREILDGLGYFGHDEIHAPKEKAAASSGGAPKPPSMEPLKLNAPVAKGRIHDLKDGFPSPVSGSPQGSFTEAQGAVTRPHIDSLFLKQAMNETGVNPYASIQGSSGARAAEEDQQRLAGLAASPVPLVGALRPIRPASPSTRDAAASSTAAADSSRPGGILGSFARSGSSGLGGNASDTGSDYQDKIKEENRRAMATEALIAPRAARPVSANKKFLQKYNLDKLNLFAP